MIEIIVAQPKRSSNNRKSQDQLQSDSPSPLPPVSADIDIIFNKKPSNALDTASFDLNEPLEEFIDHIHRILSKKTKLSLENVKSSTIIIRYGWMTSVRAQGKTLPKLHDLNGEENYSRLCRDIQDTARKNRYLDNMTLRLQIDISTDFSEDFLLTGFTDLSESSKRLV